MVKISHCIEQIGEPNLTLSSIQLRYLINEAFQKRLVTFGQPVTHKILTQLYKALAINRHENTAGADVSVEVPKLHNLIAFIMMNIIIQISQQQTEGEQREK